MTSSVEKICAIEPGRSQRTSPLLRSSLLDYLHDGMSNVFLFFRPDTRCPFDIESAWASSIFLHHTDSGVLDNIGWHACVQ